jgi:fatty-acyl-CoA synthase
VGSAVVTDWVAYNARRFPQVVAVEGLDSDLSLTWSALEARVGRLAGVMRGRFGLREGDRVALIADDDPRVIELQFACMRAGVVFVPFNWRLAPPEVEELCRDAEPALIVHDATWQDLAVTLREHLGIPHIGSWGCADTPVNLEAELDGARAIGERLDHTADQVVQMLYTSGTTGTPKGALITMGSLIANTANIVNGMRLTGPPARYLSALPLFHGAGLNVVANPVLMTGGTVSIVRRFDPERVTRLLGEPAEGYTHFNAAPAMYRMLAGCAPGRDFSALKAAMAGGSWMDAGLSDHLADLGLVTQSAWGAIEMGPNLSLVPREDRAPKVHTVGFPVPHTQLRVVDPATGEDVAPGESGEAWARGPSVCAGYWRREPGAGFDGTGGWFRSGDAVSLDEDGFVVLRGRFKDMYKSGGENVFAAEVEAVLAEHPKLAEVAVVGIPDAKWGEVGRAVVVPAPGETVDLADLVEHCAPRLARYKIPKSVVVVDALPRNVLGKVQKPQLRLVAGDDHA